MYRAGVALVWFYRLTFGALFPTTCKYHPSCSQYALDAVRTKGLVRGSALDREQETHDDYPKRPPLQPPHGRQYSAGR